MSDMSKYLGNKIARWLAGNDMPTAPTDCYIALFDGDPKDAGVEVTEDVSSSGRIAITFDSISAGEDNVLASAADVDFGESENDVDLSHVAVFDAATDGNLLFARAVPGGPYPIATGIEVKFASGQIVFTIGD